MPRLSVVGLLVLGMPVDFFGFEIMQMWIERATPLVDGSAYENKRNSPF